MISVIYFAITCNFNGGSQFHALYMILGGCLNLLINDDYVLVHDEFTWTCVGVSSLSFIPWSQMFDLMKCKERNTFALIG